MNSRNRSVRSLSVLVLLLWGLASGRGLAQPIVPAADGTGTIVLPNGERFDIQGGQLSPDRLNLFHSFLKFGLDTHQIANFLSQPGIQNILARVVGGDPSVINGLLKVTGGNSNLYLMNPAGIVFGPRAQLDVPASFLATTATAIQFKSGLFAAVGQPDYGAIAGAPLGLVFPAGEPSAIVNAGSLAVQPGQGLELVGGTVVSTGSLAAPGGSIQVTAVEGGRYVRVGQAGHVLSLDLPADLGGRQLADGGIPVTALPELLRRQAGTGLRVSGDTVQLADSGLQVPTTAGTTVIAGEVNAAAGMNVTGGKGGTIHLLGNQVQLQGATVNVSGLNGGGNVLIGGDFQGSGSVPNARQTVIDQTSVIKADAEQVGDGGRVIVWADGDTSFAGKLSARGGSISGDGGFVEISGKENLFMRGIADLSASHGSVGNLLLDPTNIIISDGSDPRTTILESTIEDPSNPTYNGTSNIIFMADNDIEITSLSDDRLVFLRGGSGSISFQADSNSDGHGIFLMPPQNQIIVLSPYGLLEGRTLNISADSINAGIINTRNGVSATNQPAPGGNVNINARGDINIRSLTATADSHPIQTNFGNAGNVSIVSREGSITSTGLINTGAAQGNGGNIVLDAFRNITTAKIDSAAIYDGGNNKGGNVSIISRTGIVDISRDGFDPIENNISQGLVTSSNIGGDSGLIRIEAPQDITIRFIQAGSTAGSGSPVDIVSHNGNIRILEYFFAGGDNLGNVINIYANNGNISTGDISSTSSSGPGGSITLISGGNITTGNLTTSLPGRDGGLISLNAPGRIETGEIKSFGSPVTINSDTIQIGNVDTSSILGDAGSISLTANSLTGAVITGRLNASSRNGNFGDIAINSANSIDTTADLVLGRNINFNANGNIATQTLSSRGISATINLQSNAGSIDTTAGTLRNATSITLTAPENITTGSILTAGNLTINSTTGSINSANGSIFDTVGYQIADTDVILETVANPPIIPTLRGSNVQVTADSIIARGLETRAAGGAITLTGNEIDLIDAAGTVRTTNSSATITLQPRSPNQSIVIGGTADTGTTNLDLTQTDIAAIANGFASITIGRTDGTGSIAIPGTVTFADPTIFNAPGGTIDITGTLIGIDNAAFTFNTTLGMTLGNIITPGTDLTFNAPITLATPATISTGAGPGNITFNGTINGNNPLTVTAGTGDIQLNGQIGNTAPIGSLTVTSAANTTATANITTNNGDVTVTSPLAIAAPLTITAGTGTIALNNTVTAGPNDTTLSANEINLNGGPNSVTGSGNLTLQPGTLAQNTLLGQAADSGPTTLDLTQADILALANGFNSITIGRTGGTGAIAIPGTVTFADPVIFNAPNNSIDITGTLIGIDNAAFTFNARHMSLGNIITPGTDLTFNTPITLVTPATVDTGPGPGNLTFNGPIDGNQPFTLNAGTGTIVFTSAIGGTTPISSLLITSAANTTLFNNITTANGNITINSPLTFAGNSILSAGTATIAHNGPVSTAANTVTLAADEIDLNGGPNSVTGSGNLTLQPGTANQAIELGATTDTGPTTLNLTAADLAALANGFNSLTIGHPNGSGTITLPVALTFFDPVTIRSPQAPGTITIADQLIGADNASITLTASRINLGNITTNNNNITLNGPATVTTGDSELNAGTATILANGQLNTGGNTLTLTADEIDFRGGNGSVLGGGNLILQPFTPSLNIEIGGFVPAAGRLDLDFADMSAIGNGFNLVTIGREDSSGTITIPNPITFLDPFKIQTPLGANTIIANGPITLIDNASIELLALGNIIFNTIDALNATGNVVITSTAGRVTGTGTFLTDAGPTTIATSTGTITITGGVVPDVPFTIGLPFDPNNPDDWNGTLGVIRTAAETFPVGTIIYGSETSPGGTMTVNAGGQRPPEPPIEPPVDPPVAPPEEPPIEPPVEPPAEDPPVEAPPVEPPVAPPDGDGIPDVRPDPTRNLLYPTLHEGKRRELAEIVAQVDQNDFNLHLSLMLNDALKALDQGDWDGIRQIEEARQLEFENYFGVEIDCSYLDTSIREESPQGSQEVSCKVLTLGEIQQALREMAAKTGHTPAVIYTIPSLDRLNVVLVKPNGNPIVKSVLEANVVTLAQQVEDFHKVAQRYDIQPDEREYQAASRPLYDWIVGAIAPDLEQAGIDTLLFSLNHRLRSVPLAILQDQQGNFLLQSYHLALIPNFSLTSRSYTRDFQQKPRLAMGRSDFAGTEWRPLPAVPTELAVVNPVHYLNADFTFNNLRTFRQNDQFGVVHLATHAKFRPGKFEDSLIQLWDQRLHLNAMWTAQLSQPNILDLLVISACETALGDREAELGFAGFAVAAGVKTAIASLWEVDDIGTLAFMAELYQVQLPQATIKAEALRNTQLALLAEKVYIDDNGNLVLSNGTLIPLPDRLKDHSSQLAHPYIWSTFTLIGSPW